MSGLDSISTASTASLLKWSPTRSWQKWEDRVNFRPTEHQYVEPAATPDGSDGLPLEQTAAPHDPGQLGWALLRLANRHTELRVIPNPAAENDLPGSSQEYAGRRADRDRRAYPRRDSGCDVRVHCLIVNAMVSSQQMEWLLHATPLRGSLVDLSMNGIAFLLDQPLKSSSRVLLRLTSRTTSLSVDISAMVLRSSRERSGCWKVVGRLDHNLTLEQAHEFGRHLATAAIV